MEKQTKLGKYELSRELGKGAMGVVYEGFDPFIERTVAIKTILKSTLDGAEAQDILNRFRREAQAAGRLTHRNIVSIYEYGEDNDVAFIAMEFVQGKELKEYFDCGERFQITDAVRIMSQLLEALDYSHRNGVVHRDIKPANIIIANSGQVKVADFGIARIESSNLTQVGTVLGTPAYMSPEQFMGLAVDRRTDIYSAGVILYQFLTGEKPFTGSAVAIMHKVLNQEIVAPSVVNFSVSPALDDVVRKAMAKRIEDRFQTAREFMDALMLANEDISTADPDATLVSFNAVTAIRTNAQHDNARRTQIYDENRISAEVIDPTEDQTVISPIATKAETAPAAVVLKKPQTALTIGLMMMTAVALLTGATVWYSMRKAPAPEAPSVQAVLPATQEQPALPVVQAPPVRINAVESEPPIEKPAVKEVAKRTKQVAEVKIDKMPPKAKTEYHERKTAPQKMKEDTDYLIGMGLSDSKDGALKR